MDIPLLFRRCLQLREYCKALAVRRQVVVQKSVDIVKLLIGPRAQLASSMCKVFSGVSKDQ